MLFHVILYCITLDQSGSMQDCKDIWIFVFLKNIFYISTCINYLRNFSKLPAIINKYTERDKD